MKVGIIISVNDDETCWNAFRLANYSLGQKDDVRIFLMGKGVEYQSTSTSKFDAVEQAETFLANGGKMLACGTCIKSRQQKENEMCPLSTMKDMYEIVRDCDKVVSF